MIEFIYSDAYLRWQLGDGHPTDPRRAQRALRLIEAMEVPHRLTPPRMATFDELLLVHDADYVASTVEGHNGEWAGRQPELGATAMLMAGGTMRAVDMLLAEKGRRFFNPQGAKHHAMRDHGSGFCVFNDMAMAARRLNDAGLRVLYVDWDVHHGDGVEALCADMPMTMTASVHGYGFPGTGKRSIPEVQAWNAILPDGSGDADWLGAISQALVDAIEHTPDVVLLATGADSHRTDPLGMLNITVDGYRQAAQMVSDFADGFCEGRIIVGGAGGYQPRLTTPLIWASVAAVLADVRERE